MDNWMNEWITENVEGALGFKLHDWQLDYIFDRPCNIPEGRRVGFTTAYILKLIISEGKPIRLDKPGTLVDICDEDNGVWYYRWFEHEFSDIYYMVSHTKLKRILRPVKFRKEVAV